MTVDFSNGDPIPVGVNTFTYQATGGVGTNTITVDDAGSFSLTNSSLQINSLPQNLGTGVQLAFPVAGQINNAVFDPPDSYDPTNATPSTYTIGSGATLWTGNAVFFGETNLTSTSVNTVPNTIIASTKNTTTQSVSLSNQGLQVSGGQFFAFLNDCMLVANITLGVGGANPVTTPGSYIDISGWSGTGSLNGLGDGGLGYFNTPVTTSYMPVNSFAPFLPVTGAMPLELTTGGSTYFAYSSSIFAVYQSEVMSLVGFTNLLLNGNGASNETFNNLGWNGNGTVGGTVNIYGGPGTDSLYTSPTPGTITTPRNFSLYSPVSVYNSTSGTWGPGPGFVYDGLLGGLSNFAAENPATGVAYNNYVNGGPGSTFDLSNYSSVTSGVANGFDFVYVNGNGSGTTLNDAPPSGNQSMVLTNSSLFAATTNATPAAAQVGSTSPPIAAVAPTRIRSPC